MALADLPVGVSGRVFALQGEPAVCSRLREMGFCESAVIERLGGRKTLLCELCGVRMALNDRAAAHVLVELISAGA